MTEQAAEETKVDDGKGHELFAKATERTNDLLAELIEQNRALRQPQKPDAPARQAPQIYTQEQLQTAVDAGQITVGQMVEYLASVKANAAVDQMRATFKDELAAERQKGSVETKLAAFRASYPDLNKKGSETREKVAAAFAELVEEGHSADDLRTELMACRIALGDPEKTPKPKETTSTRQRSVETSGSRSDKGEKGGGDGWPSWVPAENRAHWERRIEQGHYKGIKDEKLQKELGYLKRQLDNPRPARRRGAA